ncbi:MAG: hypothetical protein AAF919_06250 [Pseudomonadota bacterium]
MISHPLFFAAAISVASMVYATVQRVRHEERTKGVRMTTALRYGDLAGLGAWLGVVRRLQG